MDGCTKAQVGRPQGPKTREDFPRQGFEQRTTEQNRHTVAQGWGGVERTPEHRCFGPGYEASVRAASLPAVGYGLLVSLLIMLVLSMSRTEPKGKAS